MNLIDRLARQRGLNIPGNTPPQPYGITNPLHDADIAQMLQNSPSDFGQMPPMDEGLFDVEQPTEQGDAEPIPLSRISAATQEWLGTKEPDQGGLIKQILSMRKGPTSEDAARSATDTLSSGKYVSSQSYADARFKNDFSTIAALSKLQNGGSSGNSVYAQTLKTLKDTYPEEYAKNPMAFIRLAQNKIGTNLNFDPVTGRVTDMDGAAQGLGNIEGAKRDAQNQSDLGYKPKIAGEEKTAQLNAEKVNDAPKALNTLKSTQASHQFVVEELGRAIPMVNVWTAGAVGQPLASVAGTPASNLRNKLDTIKANIGFDKLAEMKANSPTGSALGAVSDTENRLLASTWGSVEQSNSPQALRDNLMRMQNQIVSTNQRLAQAYERDYGTREGAPQVDMQDFSASQSTTQAPQNVIRYDAQGNRL